MVDDDEKQLYKRMGAFLFYLLVICQAVSVVQGEDFIESLGSIHRSSFPAGFKFGTATAAYQVEGAANEDGKGKSIWDTFTHKYPGKIKDHSNGDIAVDSYHRYKEDVAIMKNLGFDAYRFSISWSRLLPRGHLSGGVNQEGINYYNNLINELLLNGIQPFVTLFHWDLPQTLEDEYGGFLSSKIIQDFQNYAELCFFNFGDRVRHWITLNEPLTVAKDGYTFGTKAPGRCSKWISPNCTGGNSGTEPYIVAHNQLLSHAASVRVYKDKYQMSQKGQIGITINTEWAIAMNAESTTDSVAASRAIVFKYDWFMEPLKSGLYPAEMVTYVGERMPNFSKEESLMLKGSFDFIGINYYTTNYATNVPCQTENFSYSTDSCVLLTSERNGIPIGPPTASDWLYVYPRGMLDLLLYTKYKFNDPVIYITENGLSQFDSDSVLEDNMRVDYYNDHLLYVQQAIMNGVNIKGFFAWSLLDNFEWDDGVRVRFGIVYIDYKDGLRRHLKKSATWFKEFLQMGNWTLLKKRDLLNS